MKNIETQLQSHISNLFDRLEKLDPGSEEYMRLAEVTQKFYDIRNDEIKIHAEEAKAFDSNELEKERLEFEKKRAIFDFKMRKAELVAGIMKHATTMASYIQSFKITTWFEQTGVASSKFWMFIPKTKLI